MNMSDSNDKPAEGSVVNSSNNERYQGLLKNIGPVNLVDDLLGLKRLVNRIEEWEPLRKDGAKPFDWNPTAHNSRSFTSWHWWFDPIRNTDPRVSYQGMPAWEQRWAGDRGLIPMFQNQIQSHIPTISQYRAMMPPKNPLESPWPMWMGMFGLGCFAMKNVLFGYNWYTGFLTRGHLYAVLPFYWAYYTDRYFDMELTGQYKLALDYIRENSDKLEPTPNKRYCDPDMLIPWRPHILN